MIRDDLTFPLRLSRGAGSGLTFNTEVAEIVSGAEQRNAIWAEPLLNWTVEVGAPDVEELMQLRDFFRLVRGRLIGFRVRDPLEFSSAPYVGQTQAAPTPLDQPMVAADGGGLVWRLVRRVTIGPDTLDIAVRRPVASAFRVSVGGAEALTGWTLDAATGLVTFDAAPASPRWGGEFDFAGRFDSDELFTSVTRYQAGEVLGAPIRGLR